VCIKEEQKYHADGESALGLFLGWEVRRDAQEPDHVLVLQMPHHVQLQVHCRVFFFLR